MRRCETVAIGIERAISGIGVSHILDRLALGRGLPGIIRSGNGKAFCSKDMVKWVPARRRVETDRASGKPNRNGPTCGVCGLPLRRVTTAH